MKTGKFKLVYLASAIVLILFWVGCSHPKQYGLVFFNDFEEIKGWTDASSVVRKIKPHSGMFSCLVDSMHPYGLTLKLGFQEIFDKPIKKVKIKTWVYTNSLDTKGTIVLEISAPDKQILLWIDKKIRDEVKETGKWTLMEMEFTIPNRTYSSKNIIKIYPWNVEKKEIYVDDMEVEFVI